MIRSRYTTFAGMLFVLVMFASTGIAQTAPRIVNGGVLNGKAVSLPKPEYPESARSSGASGMIAVNITIDESGAVIAAAAELNDQRERRDVDGTKLEALPADPMLRDAAEKAAWKAKFSPTRLNDIPIQVKGKVVYNFVAGDQTANAIAPPPSIPKTITGAVLNGKAISLPAPGYPPAAMAVRAEGTVSVQVLIDEEGNVIQAEAVSGHPLLRSAAETAARGARFSPTSLSGNPVKVSGVVTYNFVLPPKKDQ